MTLSYEGTAYAGWQRQSNHPSVQQTLETGLEKILGHTVKLIGASRTDAGAHALAQCANFHTSSGIPLAGLHRALWSVLPNDVVVIDVEEVPDRFHARFDAVARTYRYDILNQETPDPFLAYRAYHVPRSLSLLAMRRAGAAAVGTLDFSSLCTHVSDLPHAVRTLTRLKVSRRETVVSMTVTANGFLRGMIRTLVQILVETGLGRRPIGFLGGVLKKKDRQAAPKAAPAHGLYLIKVDYPFLRI